MPYVQKRTWIQMAPRIRGLSLPESQRGFPTPKGMGQANCPSLEQLMGITDPSDPCQSGGAATSAQAVMTGPTPTASEISPYATVTGSLSSNSLSTWFQANQTTVLMIGGGLFVLALISGMGKR
jgi:hypothetical protein